MGGLENALPAKPILLDSEKAASGEKGERQILPFMPIVAILFGFFLIWRALPRPFTAVWSYLEALGVSLGAVAALGGIVAFAFRPNKSVSSFSSAKPILGAIIAGSTALACIVDILAGRSVLVLVCGSVFLGLLYWDRPKYLFALIGADALATAISAFWGAAAFPGSAFDPREQLALALAGSGLGASAALTIRKVVTPGAERMRSLERENRELWDLSFRDGLTGLYNRRFAQESGEKLYSRAMRYHERFHVLMIDIDHFKRVNDKMGHAIGDEVLKDIASILQSCVRSSDIAARYGGEEFIVFLLEAEHETAQYIANRIRDDVAAHRFEHVPWQVTISVGIAGREEGEILEALVDRADKRLYYAKHSGRNRVAGF